MRRSLAPQKSPRKHCTLALTTFLTAGAFLTARVAFLSVFFAAGALVVAAATFSLAAAGFCSRACMQGGQGRWAGTERTGWRAAGCTQRNAGHLRSGLLGRGYGLAGLFRSRGFLLVLGGAAPRVEGADPLLDTHCMQRVRGQTRGRHACASRHLGRHQCTLVVAGALVAGAAFSFLAAPTALGLAGAGAGDAEAAFSFLAAVAAVDAASFLREERATLTAGSARRA